MGKTDRVKLSTKKHGRRKLYHGNRFTRKIVEEMEEVEQQQSATTPTPQPENTAIQQEENISEHPKKTLVSAAKVQKIVTDIPTQNDPKIMGYRFVDMELLGDTIKMLCYPLCKRSYIKFHENFSQKKGFLSNLTLKCKL